MDLHAIKRGRAVLAQAHLGQRQPGLLFHGGLLGTLGLLRRQALETEVGRAGAPASCENDCTSLSTRRVLAQPVSHSAAHNRGKVIHRMAVMAAP
jgi:hypothetical protein